jgi:hypothetical protein
MVITIEKEELSHLVERLVEKHLSKIVNDPDNGLELSSRTLRRLKKYEDPKNAKGISLAALRKKYG